MLCCISKYTMIAMHACQNCETWYHYVSSCTFPNSIFQVFCWVDCFWIEMSYSYTLLTGLSDAQYVGCQMLRASMIDEHLPTTDCQQKHTHKCMLSLALQHCPWLPQASCGCPRGHRRADAQPGSHQGSPGAQHGGHSCAHSL